MIPLRAGLYIVSTPIGHKDDITKRAIETLEQADIILAEDTRLAKKLLSMLSVSVKNKTIIAHHAYNEQGIERHIQEWITQQRIVALISDAGTPLVCDPGYPLIQLAQKHRWYYTAIPGACSVINALTLSGLSPYPFAFYGFLPHKQSERMHTLQTIRDIGITTVVFDTPHRLLSSLDNIRDVFGSNHRINVSREMTKVFESSLTSTVADIINYYQDNAGEILRGEIVIVIEKYISDQNNMDSLIQELNNNTLFLETFRGMLNIMPLKQATQYIINLTHLPRNAVYAVGVMLKNDTQPPIS